MFAFQLYCTNIAQNGNHAMRLRDRVYQDFNSRFLKNQIPEREILLLVTTLTTSSNMVVQHCFNDYNTRSSIPAPNLVPVLVE